jgi:hypothetical protein
MSNNNLKSTLDNLKIVYNNTITNLTAQLNIEISNIQNKPLVSSSIKKTEINKIINIYNNNYKIIKEKYDQSISYVKKKYIKQIQNVNTIDNNPSLHIQQYVQYISNILTTRYNRSTTLVNNDHVYNLNNIKNSKKTKNEKDKAIKIENQNYNKKLTNLKKQFDKDIYNINNFQPTILNNDSYDNMNPIFSRKKALLIGNDYNNDFGGAASHNVTIVTNRLKKVGFDDGNIIKILTKSKDDSYTPSTENIKREFINLLTNSQDGDLLFFYFSGHGSYVADKNNDELTENDQCILDKNYNGDNLIDDWFRTQIDSHLVYGATLVCLFECCHSGTMLDLKYNHITYPDGKLIVNEKVSDTVGNVFMFGGCLDEETVKYCPFDANEFPNNKYPSQMYGAFTICLIDILDTLSKNKQKTTWADLIDKLRAAIYNVGFNDQHPTFASGKMVNIDTMNVFI